MAPWCRASALDRHMACQAASWLPKWDRASWIAPNLGLQPLPLLAGPEKSWDAADWGTRCHEAKAGTGVNPYQEAFDEKSREKYWPTRLGNHEVAFAYDCDTGITEIGPTNLPVEQMDHWKGSRADSCIIGTSDWAALLPSGEPWIDDLKTGWKKPPVKTLAMLFYGLCWQRLNLSSTVRLSISHLPRAKVIDLNNLKRYWLQVGIMDLDNFADDCHIAWRKTRPRKRLQTYPYAGMVHPGEHCGYCPSASICPAHIPAGVTETDTTLSTAD